eukprot:GHVU01146543.1.p1 GENE.GHVU01146543.1~~GHVU01146543.1.p1  ORF type:complete len:358 (-),score=58.87 GHVU01146543.1:1035-2108(-)
MTSLPVVGSWTRFSILPLLLAVCATLLLSSHRAAAFHWFPSEARLALRGAATPSNSHASPSSSRDASQTRSHLYSLKTQFTDGIGPLDRVGGSKEDHLPLRQRQQSSRHRRSALPAGAAAASIAPAAAAAATSLRAHTLDGTSIARPLQPLHGQVLIKRSTPRDRSAGGILLPHNAQEARVTGEVMAVGRGIRNSRTGVTNPVDVRVGDRVLFGTYDGQSFKYDGYDAVLVAVDAISAVVVDSPEDADSAAHHDLSPHSFLPLEDRLLVELIPLPEKSKGGLLLHSGEGDKNKEALLGKVVKIGPGMTDDDGDRIPIDISEGEGVQFPEYAIDGSREMKIEGRTYAFVKASDVLAKW